MPPRLFFPAIVLFVAAATASAAGSAGAKLDSPAPEFTLVDSEGSRHSLSDFKGKWVVLEWVNYDCPFVRKHYGSGNMQKLQKTYTGKGVVWLSVCSSAPGKQGHFSGSELKERIAKEKGAQTAYLVDEEGTVGKAYDAKTTPHMFIVDPKGTLAYAGGIDDIASTSQDDIARAENYVSMALDAALAGKPIATKGSKPYGCSVKYK
jgi:peroxiredoxin